MILKNVMLKINLLYLFNLTNVFLFIEMYSKRKEGEKSFKTI